MTNENAQTEQTETKPAQIFSQNREYRQKTPYSVAEPRGGRKTQPTATQDNPAPSKEATQKPDPKGNDDIWEKRYGDLRADSDKKQKALGEQLKQALDRLSELEQENKFIKESSAKKPALTSEELEALAKEFPDFDKLASTRGQLAAQEYASNLQKEVDSLKKELEQMKVEKARNKLYDLHPDFEKIERDPEFHEWVKDQPKGIQSLFSSDSIQDVSRGLDLYKREKGLDPKSKKQKELDDTRAVETTSAPMVTEGAQKKIWTRQEIKALNPNAKDFAETMAEVNAAMREGRVR